MSSLLVLLVFAFFAVTNFFPWECGAYVLLSSGLAFVIIHVVYYAKNEASEHVPRCPTFCLGVSV